MCQHPYNSEISGEGFHKNVSKSATQVALSFHIITFELINLIKSLRRYNLRHLLLVIIVNSLSKQLFLLRFKSQNLLSFQLVKNGQDLN